MRRVAAMCLSFLGASALLFGSVPAASAFELQIANDTPYEILGFSLEGLTGDGQEASSFQAVRALPGESCGENNGIVEKPTALGIDFGRGRVLVRGEALKGLRDKASLRLRLDEAGRPLLALADGGALPADFVDLRFPEQDEGPVDFMELIRAADRDALLKLGGAAAREFKEFGDVVLPVRFGAQVWTGAVGLAPDGVGLGRVRLMTERSSSAWREVLLEFLAVFELRPLSLTLPDGAAIRFHDESAEDAKNAEGADGAEAARDHLLALLSEVSPEEGKPSGDFTALFGTEAAFQACARPDGPIAPSLGAFLRLNASELLILDVEKDISGRVELERAAKKEK